MDLDRFKLVNDSFGHEAGDELVRLVAARLKHCVRDSDLLFRMGGDEFTILPEGLDYPEGAVRLANRILRAMEEQPYVIKGHSIVVTTSIGISIFPKDDAEPEKIVKNADAAMYLAKEAGGNQYRFYTPELNERALEQLALESGLQQALRNGVVAEGVENSEQAAVLAGQACDELQGYFYSPPVDADSVESLLAPSTRAGRPPPETEL